MELGPYLVCYLTAISLYFNLGPEYLFGVPKDLYHFRAMFWIPVKFEYFHSPQCTDPLVNDFKSLWGWLGGRSTVNICGIVAGSFSRGPIFLFNQEFQICELVGSGNWGRNYDTQL